MEVSFGDSYRLMMEGSRAFSQIESNGMRLDVEYLDRMINETGMKIRELEDSIKQDEVWKTWKRIYGTDANLGSDTQLGHVIFDVLGVPCKKRTATGKPATDEDSLEDVDFPFVKKINTIEKLKRARSTNLIGLRREQVGGILRPNFNLHIAITFRSSTSDPNSQNIPVRDPRLSKLVRRAFIPRNDDYTLLEVDMSGAEVRVATCYHKDPTMKEYLLSGHDFHKDLAMQCYLLTADQVDKAVRGTAKAGFVFASFYGDWFVQIAINLWTAIDRDELKTKDGVSLKEHLAKHGITELGDPKQDSKNPKKGTFLKLIKEVYEDFWGRRFKVYAQWKEDWWSEYLKHGMFQTYTGFICRGIYEKNKAINYPIQGSSFHCLLWSLIEMNNWLVSNKMRTMIIGQIHDSIIFDIHKSEYDLVIEKLCQVMLRDVRKHWSWISIPLEIEAEGSPVNWYEKSKIVLPV